MSNSNNMFIDWDEQGGGSNDLKPGFKSFNLFQEKSAFKNSPFGEHWEKDLPSWALAFYGSAKVISKPNFKFVDKNQIISQSKADAYTKLSKGKIKPYEYKIFYHSAGDGEEVLKIYNDPKTLPTDNEIFVFIEIDDGKFDFGKIVRVKLGSQVINDMKFKFTESYLSDDELADEIIRKINLLKDDNIIVEDIKNSKDFNKLLLRAIDFEYNNKKFDEFSLLILLTSELEFLEFKSIDWLKDISGWLRERKYEDKKYWDGHLDKGYEPAFLPTSFFNKTKEEKEKLINKMVNEPLSLIDKLLEEKFGEKSVLSDFIKPKLQTFKDQINQKLKPHGLQLIEAIDVVESVETIVQYYNALWVGIWNGILEFIAGLIDLVGIILIIIKQEVGFRITDALWEKIENLFNFVYYETGDFLDLILDKAITFVYQVYYLDFNGYEVAKEIGELIPDIVTFAISWIKAAKIAKAGSVAVAAEEIAAKEALEKLEKESIEEAGEKAVKEAEENLFELFSKIIGKPIDLKLLKELQEKFSKLGGDMRFDVESFEYCAAREKSLSTKIEAITLAEDLIMLNKTATTSAVYEELIHAKQFRTGRFSEAIRKYKNNELVDNLMEKEAAEELLKNSAKWKLPKGEIELIKQRLEIFNKELKRLGYEK
jgi:hypothetical protein